MSTERIISAISKLLRRQRFDAGLIALLLVGVGVLLDRHPDVLRLLIEAFVSAGFNAQVFWTGFNLILLIFVALYVRAENIESKDERDLCRAEQSAMRSAIVSLVLALPQVQKETGEKIIFMLDKSMELARDNFIKRASHLPIRGGRRTYDLHEPDTEEKVKTPSPGGSK